MTENSEHTETVPVEVRDPALTERANEIMTDEARAALGTDHVELPADRAGQAGRRHPSDRRMFAALWERRVLIGLALATAVVVAGILVLTTGAWGFIAVPLVLLAVTVPYAVRSVFETTTLAESPAPEAVAALDREGVRDPERLFNEHVESFTAEGPRGAQGPMLAEEDPGGSMAAQQGRMTPSSEPTTAAPAEPGEGGADMPAYPVLWPAAVAVVLMIITLVVGIVEGGLMWLVPAVCWPCGLGLVAYEVVAFRRSEAARDE